MNAIFKQKNPRPVIGRGGGSIHPLECTAIVFGYAEVGELWYDIITNALFILV